MQIITIKQFDIPFRENFHIRISFSPFFKEGTYITS